MGLTPLELYEQNKNLIYLILKKYYVKNEQGNEDLKSAAKMGLWMACRKFDASYKVKFSTYACNYIRNTVIDTLKFLTNYDKKTKTAKIFHSFTVETQNNYLLTTENEVFFSIKDIYFDVLKILKKYLSKEQYRVFFLKNLYGYSFKQIENMTGIKMNTGRLRYLEALKLIKSKKFNRKRVRLLWELNELKND